MSTSPIRESGATAEPAATRRRLLAGTAAVGTITLIGSCGPDNSESLPATGESGPVEIPFPGGSGIEPGGQRQVERPSQAPAEPGTGFEEPGAGVPHLTPGQALARLSDVPVGGGVIIPEHEVVVTQPASGDVRGFINVCAHAGCPMESVANGTINCGCHGSRYSIVDGSVQGGPAPNPLTAVALRIDGDTVAAG